jgi:hypothetical protein
VGSGKHRKLVQLGDKKIDVKAISAVGNVGNGGDHFGIRSAVRSPDSWVNVSNNVLMGYTYGGVNVTKGHNVNVSNNLVAGGGNQGGIFTSGYSNHKITGNIVRGVQNVGIRVRNQMAPTTVAQNQVRFCQKQGIVVDQSAGSSDNRGAVVSGNALEGNDQGGNGVPELDVNTENVLAFGNHVAGRGGSVSFSDSATGNLWVGNMAPADGSAWNLSFPDSVRTMANRPNPAGKGFVLTSPNGTEYEITVADDGTLKKTQF